MIPKHISKVKPVARGRDARLCVSTGEKLPEGWEWKSLSEIFTINPQKKISKEKLKDQDEISFVPMKCLNVENRNLTLVKTKLLKEVYSSYTYFENNDVLLAKITPCFENGKVGIAKRLVNGIGFGSSEFIVLRSDGHVIAEYLYYFISQESFRNEGKNRMTGAVGHKRVSKDFIEDYLLPYPNSIDEQKRIVAILDEAFAAIDKAKANAEKNLANAKELFESYLNGIFSNPGENWEEKRFDEICVLQRGFDLPTRLRNKGSFPLVSSNGITDRIDQWKVNAPGVVTGRSGTIGNVHFIEKYYWPLNTALYIKEFHGNYERCIYYFLKQFNLGKYRSGAGVPTLNRNNVHSEMVWFPISQTEQQIIVQKLDNLSSETKKLETVYQQKIDSLEELKKSVLQKVFDGKL